MKEGQGSQAVSENEGGGGEFASRQTNKRAFNQNVNIFLDFVFFHYK